MSLLFLLLIIIAIASFVGFADGGVALIGDSETDTQDSADDSTDDDDMVEIPDASDAGDEDESEPSDEESPKDEPEDSVDAEEPDDAAPVAAPAAVMDVGLMQRARAVGINDATIAALGTNDQLKGYMQAVGQQAALQPVTAESQAPKAFELKLDEANMDAELLQAFRGMNDHHTASTAALYEKVQQQQVEMDRMTKAVQVQQHQSDMVYLQGKVSSLDEGLKKEMASPGRLEGLRKVMLSLGDAMPEQDTDALFDSAIRAMNGNAIAKQERTKIEKGIVQQSKSVAARATKRKKSSDKVDKFDEAIDAFRRMQDS